MPLDFTCRPPESFFTVILPFLTAVDIIAFFLKFGESGGKLVALVEELPHLGEQNGVGQEQSAVFVVICEVVIFFWVGKHYSVS